MRTKSNLKSLLETKNMSIYRLQKLTGISYANLHKYSTDKVSRYNSEVLAKICKALECEIGDLLTAEFK